MASRFWARSPGNSDAAGHIICNLLGGSYGKKECFLSFQK